MLFGFSSGGGGGGVILSYYTIRISGIKFLLSNNKITVVFKHKLTAIMASGTVKLNSMQK